MFTKTQTSQERLNAWRTVRKQDYKTVEPLLEAFADIKPIPRYIDYYTPRDWPNVFDRNPFRNIRFRYVYNITFIVFYTLSCYFGFTFNFHNSIF